MDLNVSATDASSAQGVPSVISLTPSNATGAMLLAQVAFATALGLGLSVSASVLGWLLGQLLLAVVFLQWFVLLHEAGHHTLFRVRALNIAAGHIAGFFALIPFASWRRVHGLHHLWTGWQDLDPTTAALAPRTRTAWERRIVDVAWRWWLPLFSVVYRLSNFWNLGRLKRMFVAPAQQRALAVNAGLLIVVYGVLLWTLGPLDALRLFGLALLLGLALQDPLILSQHTHIPQRLSQGRRVAPLSGAEQEPYTRSLRVRAWVSRWILFGFEAHELHHRWPGVPGYRLANSAGPAVNAVHWWSWLRAAKRLRGSVFLFGNRNSSGFRW